MLRNRGECLASLLVPLTMILVSAQPTGAEGLSDLQQQQLSVHLSIISKLQTYTPEQQFKMVYGLVAKANERDRDRHRRQAESLAAKAEETRGKNQAAAQEYAKAARGYAMIAELNHKVAASFARADQDSMTRALGELMTACQQVAKATGKPVSRDWFTPEESEAYALAEILRRQQPKKGD